MGCLNQIKVNYFNFVIKETHEIQLKIFRLMTKRLSFLEDVPCKLCQLRDLFFHFQNPLNRPIYSVMSV